MTDKPTADERLADFKNSIRKLRDQAREEYRAAVSYDILYAEPERQALEKWQKRLNDLCHDYQIDDD
jgi:hypothetical protein